MMLLDRTHSRFPTNVLAISILLLAFPRYSPAAEAQPASVLLWPDGAPGAIGESDADKPALYVHPVKPQESVGTAVVICPGGGYPASD